MEILTKFKEKDKKIQNQLMKELVYSEIENILIL